MQTHILINVNNINPYLFPPINEKASKFPKLAD